jgi:tetratricopeptide (TPR) repeat protein
VFDSGVTHPPGFWKSAPEGALTSRTKRERHHPGGWPDGILPSRPCRRQEYVAELRVRHVVHLTDDAGAALADVLLWQRNYTEALLTLDRARKISPSAPEILSRRARVLGLLGRIPEARSEYQRTLQFDSQNKDARTGLATLRGEAKHELRISEDVDFFNFASAGQTQSFSLSSRWNHRWSTVFGVSTNQRFGQDAVRFLASTTFHVTARDWFTVGSAVSNNQSVVPTLEAFYEYGHGFRIENRWLRGLDCSYQQHWFWYQGAHVLTLNMSQLVYLPREWTWGLNVTGARTGFVER